MSIAVDQVSFSAGNFTNPSAFIDRKLRVEQVAMILDQPFDPGGTTGLLIG